MIYGRTGTAGKGKGGAKGGKKKGFEKEGGVGGERMPTTPPPPLQCCDTRARAARTASRKGCGREGGKESCMGNGKKIRRRRSEEKIGARDGGNISKQEIYPCALNLRHTNQQQYFYELAP